FVIRGSGVRIPSPAPEKQDSGNRRGLRGYAHWRRSFRALHQSIFRRVIGVRRAFSHCVSRAERCWAVSVLCCALPDGVFGFAQVGERLKPTDCKSVPLRRYGGSNLQRERETAQRDAADPGTVRFSSGTVFLANPDRGRAGEREARRLRLRLIRGI